MAACFLINVFYDTVSPSRLVEQRIEREAGILPLGDWHWVIGAQKFTPSRLQYSSYLILAMPFDIEGG